MKRRKTAIATNERRRQYLQETGRYEQAESEGLTPEPGVIPITFGRAWRAGEASRKIARNRPSLAQLHLKQKRRRDMDARYDRRRLEYLEETGRQCQAATEGLYERITQAEREEN